MKQTALAAKPCCASDSNCATALRSHRAFLTEFLSHATTPKGWPSLLSPRALVSTRTGSRFFVSVRYSIWDRQTPSLRARTRTGCQSRPRRQEQGKVCELEFSWRSGRTNATIHFAGFCDWWAAIELRRNCQVKVSRRVITGPHRNFSSRPVRRAICG